MEDKIMKRAFIALATLGATVTAAPAFAEIAESQTMQVEYADLNLASPAGQKTLDQRITKAARQVCGMDGVRTGTRLNRKEATDCFRAAKAQAEKQFAALIDDKQLGG